MGGGAYLVNGEGDDGHKSGIAWYSVVNHDNFGMQPDAYIDIGNAGHYVRWENQELKGTFNDGNVFSINIVGDAQSKGTGDVVGSASNNFQTFNTFKADNKEVFEKGGYTFHRVYYCE